MRKVTSLYWRRSQSKFGACKGIFLQRFRLRRFYLLSLFAVFKFNAILLPCAYVNLALRINERFVFAYLRSICRTTCKPLDVLPALAHKARICSSVVTSEALTLAQGFATRHQPGR